MTSPRFTVKSLILLLAATLAAPAIAIADPAAPAGDAPTRGAFVRMRELISNSPLAERNIDAMKTQFSDRKQKLLQADTRIKADEQKIGSMDAEARKAFDERKAQLLEDKRQFVQEYKKREEELIAAAVAEIRAAVAAVAVDVGADAVLRDPAYASSNLDITDLVVRKLKQRSLDEDDAKAALSGSFHWLAFQVGAPGPLGIPSEAREDAVKPFLPKLKQLVAQQGTAIVVSNPFYVDADLDFTTTVSGQEGGGSASAAGTSKVTKCLFVRGADAVHASPQYQKGVAAVKEEFEAKKTALGEELAQAAKDQQALNANARTTDPQKQLQLQIELDERKAQLDARREQFANEFKQRDLELSRPVMEKFKNAASKVGHAKGANLIILDPVYVRPAVDITDDVEKEMAASGD